MTIRAKYPTIPWCKVLIKHSGLLCCSIIFVLNVSIFQDNEGSGIGEDKIISTGTHDDDEDYEVSSGDEIIELIPDDDDDEDNDNDGKDDDDYYIYGDQDKKKVGSSDDEDDALFDGSGSGDGLPEKEIGKFLINMTIGEN